MTNGEPLSPSLDPVSPAAEVELRPAKINDRFIAYVLDAVPFAGGYLMTLIIAVMKLHAAARARPFTLRVAAVWAGLYILYQFAGNAAGATVGKRLMGIRVVRKDGAPLGLGRSFARALGYLLSTPMCNLGFLIALFHPESRALHDLISGSLVIEPRPKNSAESAVLFVGAMGLVIAMFGGTIYVDLNLPTAADLLAIEKAQDGLGVMAQIEEAYKARAGTYTSSLADLAAASGDVEKFKSAMGELFDPNLFQLQAGNRRYRILAAAKDRKKTRVALEGPPAALVR